jgi:hypothetical protein
MTMQVHNPGGGAPEATAVYMTPSSIQFTSGLYGTLDMYVTRAMASCTCSNTHVTAFNLADSGSYTASLSYSITGNAAVASLYVSMYCTYYFAVNLSGCAGFSSISLYGTNSTSYGQVWNVQDCHLTQAQVDSILSTMTMRGTMTGSASLNLTGTSNAAPSVTGWGNYDWLLAHGWSVSVNGSHP